MKHCTVFIALDLTEKTECLGNICRLYSRCPQIAAEKGEKAHWNLLQDAITDIHELQAENKALQQENERLKTALKKHRVWLLEKSAEFEALQEESEEPEDDPENPPPTP